MLRIAILLLAGAMTEAMDQLHIKHEWKLLDYEYPSEEMRSAELQSGGFVPANNMPMGLEVYGDRLFVTVPRWRSGVPASLNYINITESNVTSPRLNPYPNWAAHRGENGSREITSPFRVRADRCGRLWVVDSGKINILENSNDSVMPSLIIYDLSTDSLLRKFEIPKEQIKEGSFFANIAVEDFDCDDAYAYIADVLKPGLIVYSWANNESWRVSHHFFHPDPLACEFNIRGLNFSWDDGVFGLGLSAQRPDNYSTLYFHPLASYNEFAVSTKVLRNKTAGDDAFHEFKMLGSRGPNAQSSVSFLDKNTGVLFYSLVNLNAVACWRTTNKEYSLKSQGRIYMNNVSMVFPSDIKVDNEERIWILSNRMPLFMYDKLDPEDINFRIFSARVVDAISHTACDTVPRVDILDKFVSKIKNLTSTTRSTSSTAAVIPSTVVLCATVLAAWRV